MAPGPDEGEKSFLRKGQLFFVVFSTSRFVHSVFLSSAGKEAAYGEKSRVLPRDLLITDEETTDGEASPRGILGVRVLGSSGSSSDNSSSSSCSCSITSSTQKVPRKKNLGLGWRNVINVLGIKTTSASSSASVPSNKPVKKALARIRSADESESDQINSRVEFVGKPSWRNFDYAELAAATDNFSPGTFFIRSFLSFLLPPFLKILIPDRYLH